MRVPLQGDADLLLDLLPLWQAQWVLTELLRFVSGVTMTAAGTTIEQVQVPLNMIVEEIDRRKIVLPTVTAAGEILILLHSDYPNWVDRSALFKALDRRPAKTIANELSRLWRTKEIEENGTRQFKLTQKGYQTAQELVRRTMDPTRRSPVGARTRSA
jgi:hypothetical protein